MKPIDVFRKLYDMSMHCAYNSAMNEKYKEPGALLSCLTDEERNILKDLKFQDLNNVTQEEITGSADLAKYHWGKRLITSHCIFKGRIYG